MSSNYGSLGGPLAPPDSKQRQRQETRSGSHRWLRRCAATTVVVVVVAGLALRRDLKQRQKTTAELDEETPDQEMSVDDLKDISEAQAKLLLPLLSESYTRSRPKSEFALYPDDVPGESSRGAPDDKVEYSTNRWRPLKIYRSVHWPSLTPFFSDNRQDDCPAVVIFPGGGFVVNAFQGEGTDIAKRFAARGVHAFVLKYRVPDRDPRPGMPHHWAALQDAQRAISLVRGAAPFWGIHPMKIGIVGFSAGGLLGALLSTHYRSPFYPAVDYADLVSARPDFALLVYAGGLLKRDSSTELLGDLHRVDGETPPTFLAHAADDATASYMNSVAYFNALANAGLGSVSELHIFGTGNHGFETNSACRPGDPTFPSRPLICDWIDPALRWMNTSLADLVTSDIIPQHHLGSASENIHLHTDGPTPMPMMGSGSSSSSSSSSRR